MNDLIIRRASETDIPDMLKLILELAEYEEGLNEVSMTEEQLRIDGFGENPLYSCLIAESEGQVIGIALYYWAYSTWNGKTMYLEDLIVTRQSRVTGAGKELMRELVRIANKEGANRLSWQVLGWNLDAQEFYRKFGASLDNEWLNGRLSQRQLAKLVNQ